MSLPSFFALIGLDAVGPAELLVLFAVVLIVVGPKNLPSAARKLGSFMASLRRAADEFKRQLMAMDTEDTNSSPKVADPEPPPPPPPDTPASDSYIDVPEPSESPVPDSEIIPPSDPVEQSMSDDGTQPPADGDAAESTQSGEGSASPSVSTEGAQKTEEEAK